MPKRPNPFAESPTIQLKTHIGMKELATGCKQEELMKAVYEKTFEKLFSGAQRISDINDNNMQSVICTPCPLDASSRFEPKQTLIDSSGCLLSSMSENNRVTTDKSYVENRGLPECSSALHSFQIPEQTYFSDSGQMCLNLSGQLMAPLKNSVNCDTGSSLQGGVKSRAVAEHLQRFGFRSLKQPSHVTAGITVCETCRHTSGNLRCQFCERAVCHGCVRECILCNEFFCPLCSTLNYDATLERTFCLGCVG